MDQARVDELNALLDAAVNNPRPCVGSGLCCKTAPCAYGEAAPGSRACRYLERWKDDTISVPRYRCGRYAFIVQQPGHEWMPAFGAGCCMPLFNRERDAIVRELVRANREGIR